MEIVGGRKYVEIAGDKMHELPPLLVHSGYGVSRLDRALDMAADIIESEHVLSEPDLAVAQEELARRRTDLATTMLEQYLGLVAHWRWGDSILEWIRQCERSYVACHRNSGSP